MNTKKLDIARLILAIISLVMGIVLTFLVVAWLVSIFSSDTSDGFSGLVFIFIFPLILVSLGYLLSGVFKIIKFKKIKNTPLNQRQTRNVKFNILKNLFIIIAVLLLCCPFLIFGLYYLIILIIVLLPKVLYFICDIIEARKKQQLKNNGLELQKK